MLGADEIIGLDSTSSDRGVRFTVDTLATRIGTTLDTDVDFGTGGGTVATWAEGNDASLIPESKLPNRQTSDIDGFNSAVDTRIGNTAVQTTGNQTVNGLKNFTNLTVNSAEVVTTSGAQSVAGVKTFTNPPVFPEGTTFPGTIQAGGTVRGTLAITDDVTIGNTATQVEAFLQTIEDAGGRQNLVMTDFLETGSFFTASATSFVLFRTGASATAAGNGEWTGTLAIIDHTTPNFPAALGNYYLIYIDVNNWFLFEIASALRGNLTIGYATNVVASQGGFTNGETVSVYRNVPGIDVRDFIDFFQTNTPVDTPYTIPSDIGLTVMDASGNERIVGGGTSVSFDTGVPTFSAGIGDGDFSVGDIVRMRLYEDDVNQATATPLIDVRKQIISVQTPVNFSISVPSRFFGTNGNQFNAVFTENGINTLSSHAITQWDKFNRGNTSFPVSTTITVTSTTISIPANATFFGGATLFGATTLGDFFDGISHAYFTPRTTDSAYTSIFGATVSGGQIYADVEVTGGNVVYSNLRTQDVGNSADIQSYTPVSTGTITVGSTRAQQITTGIAHFAPLYLFADDQIRIDRSSQVQAEAFADPVDINLDGRANVGELEVDGQTLFTGLQTTDPLIRGKMYTQTGTQLGLTGTAASLVIPIISQGPTT